MIVVEDREVDSTENVCDFSCVATFQKKTKRKRERNGFSIELSGFSIELSV
jgi:hypothetical protein